jgi:hypothetical protein
LGSFWSNIVPTSVFPNVGDVGEIKARVIALSGLIEENAKLKLIIIRVRRMLVMITFLLDITWVTSLNGTNHVFMEHLISILYELKIRIKLKNQSGAEFFQKIREAKKREMWGRFLRT